GCSPASGRWSDRAVKLCPLRRPAVSSFDFVLLGVVATGILVILRRRQRASCIEQLAGSFPGVTVRYEAPNDTVISIDRARLSSEQFALVVEVLLRGSLRQPMVNLTLVNAEAASAPAW